MIKSSLFFVCLFSSLSTIYSQATYSTITINKKQEPGLVLQVPNNTEVAEGTILQKLKETGFTPETTGSLFWKKNKKDGFYIFNGVQLPDLNNQRLNMYFKVERKSRSKKDQSTIFMLISKGDDNFISPGVDGATFTAATNFLNGFVGGTASFGLNLEIEEQAKVVKNAEKKLANLQDDERSILKKIEQLQQDLIDKKNDQVEQEKEIATEHLKLEELKLKVVKQ